MNQRIFEELLLDARITSYINGADNFKRYAVTNRNLEQFAESIVKECMAAISDQSTLDTNADFRDGFNHGRKLSWQEIRKRFEIED